jgi:hypothetical protein
LYFFGNYFVFFKFNFYRKGKPAAGGASKLTIFARRFSSGKKNKIDLTFKVAAQSALRERAANLRV